MFRLWLIGLKLIACSSLVNLPTSKIWTILGAADIFFFVLVSISLIYLSLSGHKVICIVISSVSHLKPNLDWNFNQIVKSWSKFPHHSSNVINLIYREVIYLFICLINFFYSLTIRFNCSFCPLTIGHVWFWSLKFFRVRLVSLFCQRCKSGPTIIVCQYFQWST